MEISERTYVTFKVGAVFALIAALFLGGRYWGSWEADSRHTREAVAAHELRLTSLENRMAGIDKLLVEINARQGEVSSNAASAARFGSYTVDSLARMREALAEKGVNVPPDKD